MIPSPEAATELVHLLLAARESGAPLAMPQWLAEGVTAQEAYAIQSEHAHALLGRSGGTILGWKIGGGDMATMQKAGFTGPGRGPIFSSLTFESPATLRRDGFLACIVEAEIGVVIGKDIDKPEDAEDIAGKVAAIVPCIEIADARFADFAKRPISAVIADLGYSGAWVRGQQVSDWSRVDLSKLHVRLLANGVEVRQGTGGLAMGDPFAPLRLLAADLARAGKGLKAGQVVSTGTYVMPYFAQAGESVTADFGQLGQVSATFTS